MGGIRQLGARGLLRFAVRRGPNAARRICHELFIKGHLSVHEIMGTSAHKMRLLSPVDEQRSSPQPRSNSRAVGWSFSLPSLTSLAAQINNRFPFRCLTAQQLEPQ